MVINNFKGVSRLCSVQLWRAAVLNRVEASRIFVSDNNSLSIRRAGDPVVRWSGRNRGAGATIHALHGAGRHRNLLPALLLCVLQSVRREAP